MCTLGVKLLLEGPGSKILKEASILNLTTFAKNPKKTNSLDLFSLTVHISSNYTGL